jgi:uncharacterized protein (DUF1800 family)
MAAVAVVLLLVSALAARKQQSSNAADERQRALHALNRLTFGPRPGDVQVVTIMGVDKWIEQQLHPDKIDDSAMQARLAGYRTLQMSTREMVYGFPPDPLIRAVADGKVLMPPDPYGKAVYTAALDRVQQKEQQKENAANTSPPPAPRPSEPKPAALIANTAPSQPDPKAGAIANSRAAAPVSHNVVDDLTALPPDIRMQRILALPVDQQRALTQGISIEKRQALFAGLSPAQRETVLALNNPQGVVNSEVQSAKLLRAVYSDRQLQEVLTDFWFNHFNVFIGKGADRYAITSYERDVIRPHVLGKFKDLLLATAQSPAMLFYLDNWQSEGPNSDAALGRPDHTQQRPAPRPAAWVRRPGMVYPPPPRPQQQRPAQPQANAQKVRSGLNENYGRELMELHTLGVNGGYAQHDVTEVARVFTGWTLEDPRNGGGFVFRPRLHEPGEKVVLGHRIKENGEKEGLQVLEILARNPSTARFISTELAQRFVSDNPPPSLIDAMSKTYRKTDGDLREVMRTMFRSPEFWAPEAYRARVKTPFEFVVSALRATQADISDPQPLLGQLKRMGMPLYGMQPPTGYSTKADVWVNSAALLDRMNFGLGLSTNKLPGTRFDLAQLTAEPSSADIDPYQVQIKLEQVLLQGDVSKQTHQTIEQRIVGPALTQQGQDPKRAPNVNVIAGLMLGSPEFQRK